MQQGFGGSLFSFPNKLDVWEWCSSIQWEFCRVPTWSVFCLEMILLFGISLPDDVSGNSHMPFDGPMNLFVSFILLLRSFLLKVC